MFFNKLKSLLRKPPPENSPAKKEPRNPMYEDLYRRVTESDKYDHGQSLEKKSVLEDGKNVWDPSRGENYGDFWTDVAKSRDGAWMVTRSYITDEETDAFLSEGLAEMLGRVLRLDENSHVLDVGSGTGTVAWHLAPKVAQYTMADISTTMLEHARRRLSHLGNINCQVLEACDLKPFMDNAFDAVFFEAVLVHMAKEDSYRYMQETYRVLKPGGRAYFYFNNLLHPKTMDMFIYGMEKMCDGKGNNLVSRVRYHTSAEVRHYLGRIGFEVDETCSQLSDDPPEEYLHMNEEALIAVCLKPKEESS